MKNKLIEIIFLMFCILMLTSCAATSIVTNSIKKVNNVQSIALFSTMIGKIKQPVVPLINSAILNDRINSIANQIIDLQKKYVENYRETVASSLKKYFDCEIIYGPSLASKPEIKELKVKYNLPGALNTGNVYFPKIIIASNDFNPFNFKEGNVVEYFRVPLNYARTLFEIGEKINTDLLVISYSNLTVSAPTLGPLYTIRLDTYIYFFDKEGILITDGHAWSMAVPLVKEKDIKEYKMEFDDLPAILDQMMIKVARNFKSK